jgi:raffinose/stachyose/melibiose transport system permease protein
MTTLLGMRAEERRAYWTFVLPAFIIYMLVLAFPIVISILLSLSNYNGGRMFGGDPWTLTGFQQYAKLITDPHFWLALKNNIYIVLISVFGQVPLGFIFAYLIYRKIVKGGEFWQGVLYMPNIISVIVLGIMWKMIFLPNGVIADLMNQSYSNAFTRQVTGIFNASGGKITDEVVNRIISISDSSSLSIFANPLAELKEIMLSYDMSDLPVLITDLMNLLARKWSPDFLSKQDLAMIPIMFVTLWCWTGLYLIMFLANMQKIDPQIMEAGRIDGAGEGQVMRHIVLPSMSGVIVNAAILCISGSLNSFALVWAMTEGGPMNVTELLSIYMYRTAVMGVNYPLANAISMSIVVFSIILIILTKLVEKRWGGKE